MKKNIQPALVVAAALAGATAFATTAQAIELTVSGQVNRAVMVTDNGEDTETHFVDNTSSSSRVLFKAEDAVNEQVKIGAQMEVEFQSNPSHTAAPGSDVTGEFNERKIEVYLKSAAGNVYLGQGDGAANGFTEFDLSGVGAASLFGSAHLVGGATPFDAGGATLTDAVGNFDFKSRHDRVMYQTPALGPVTLAASAGRGINDMIYEASARYASDFAFGKVLAGIGYSTEERDGAAGNQDILGGSVAVLLPAGFNVALSYSQAEDDTSPDAKQAMLRVGYKTGMHAIAADFIVTEDRAVEGDEGEGMGLNYVFTPVKWAELYATAKLYSLDRAGTDFDDITIVTAGSRVRF